jgi:hypothetical protein
MIDDRTAHIIWKYTVSYKENDDLKERRKTHFGIILQCFCTVCARSTPTPPSYRLPSSQPALTPHAPNQSGNQSHFPDQLIYRSPEMVN